MPVERRYASARRARPRGSRPYDSRVIGSTMSQMTVRVGRSRNGSITAVSGSGIMSMSELLIACQPRIEEPSKPNPSSMPDSSRAIGYVMCCHVPGKSMNLQSIITAPFFSANFSTSPGFMCECLPFARAPGAPGGCRRSRRPRYPDLRSGSDGVLARLSGADPDDLVHRGHEDLAVPYPAGASRLGDDVDHLAHAFLGNDDLQLDLGYEVNDVRRAPVDFLLAAGAPEALDLADGHAMHTDLRQALLDLVELERLDDSLDLLHH